MRISFALGALCTNSVCSCASGLVLMKQLHKSWDLEQWGWRSPCLKLIFFFSLGCFVVQCSSGMNLMRTV